MLLETLLRAVPDAHATGDTQLEITDIAYDSRAVRPGSLFVAVPSVGEDPDSGGYRFIDAAVQQGALAVATESAIELPTVTSIRIPNARAALADLADAFFDHPSRHLRAFAVTGTDGKTTTCYLLDAILTAAGYVTGLLGTIETKLGSRRVLNTDRMTTPESLDLQRTLHSMVEAGVTHVAFEASSHALVLQRLRACHFQACALTNVTGDHVEFHGSWDAYVEAKSRLFTEVDPRAPAVLNKDDSSYEHFSSLAEGRVVSYSQETVADVMACDVAASDGGFRFDLSWENRRAPVHLRLPGLFNVSNALAAAGMALAADISLPAVAAGLSTASPPPGRMQRIQCDQPFDVIVDYGHTPNAFRSVLSTLRQTSAGRLIAVFGATGNRDRQKRPVLAGIAREFADFFIITNEDPFGEDVETIISEIAAGVPASEEGTRFMREPDRGEAIRLAIQRANPGDTVVILGKGHETSIVSHGQKQAWSDTGTVLAVLRVPQ
jgi:UDP-N-acetylmuramoyl-L-alanyl-D-glutamate--2,6-diaminopimelate ligase